MSTSGDVLISNRLATDVTVTRLTTGGTGKITFNQTGGGEVVAVLVQTSSGDIRIDGSSDVSVDKVSAVGNALVINSGGAISEFGTDGTADLLGQNITLTAATDIGEATNPIEYTSPNSVSASAPGGVFLQSVP